MSRTALVIADASASKEHGISGWAAWIICDGEHVQLEGVIGTGDNNASESVALSIGISAAVIRFNLAGDDRICAVSDNTCTVEVFGGRRKSGKLALIQCAVDLVNKLKSTCGIALTTQHVKAHQPKLMRSTIQALQHWCDQQARAAVAAALAEQSIYG